MQGDCNDCNPAIHPGAMQIAGDPTDYACNGMPGVPDMPDMLATPTCDSANLGLRDPAWALAKALEALRRELVHGRHDRLQGLPICAPEEVVAKFGALVPRAGANMVLLSTGVAADKSDPDYVQTDAQNPGTNLNDSNVYANPRSQPDGDPRVLAEIARRPWSTTTPSSSCKTSRRPRTRARSPSTSR